MAVGCEALMRAVMIPVPQALSRMKESGVMGGEMVGRKAIAILRVHLLAMRSKVLECLSWKLWEVILGGCCCWLDFEFEKD